jgi:hypothetical protein
MCKGPESQAEAGDKQVVSINPLPSPPPPPLWHDRKHAFKQNLASSLSGQGYSEARASLGTQTLPLRGHPSDFTQHRLGLGVAAEMGFS